MHTAATAREYMRLRLKELAREGVAQIPDDVHRSLTREGYLTAEQEARAAASIEQAKAQLRERCDRSKPAPEVETVCYSLNVFGIRR